MGHDPVSDRGEAGGEAQANTDEPLAVTEGRTALAEPLARFAGYEFLLQCASPKCSYRCLPVDAVLPHQPEVTVGNVIDKLRCRSCGAPPAIAGLCKPNASYGFHWLLLRGHGQRWRSAIG
jgi:hypothetical protein